MRIKALIFPKIISRKKLIYTGIIVGMVLILGGIYFLSQKGWSEKLSLSGLISLIKSTEKKVAQSPSEEETLPEIKVEIPKSASSKVYEEVAEAGEGITHLARKALKQYLFEKGEGLNLTPEHKIYIEDYLQNKTGDYTLKIGQKVTFSENLIREAIEKAQTLTSQQLQNLTKYAKLVPELNY
jgi:hypothetical protein